ncbi:hypothetical protein QQS21_003111 [Conoideocrella luteorostrata]|uniref:HMG box protein n=1 Tax=Conoideocrella luteorostrata TaxID=1105319 RepID=A0AAJ0CTR3_9HYPO|nr:hypothetical protein QQS21_003111 [Conoideocrella luteorostrata]
MVTGYRHDDTKKVMVRGTISYLESQDLPVNKTAIFSHFGLSRSQGYAALQTPPTLRGDPEREELRGRPSKIRNDDQQKMEVFLWDAAYEETNLSWKGLAKLAGLEVECAKRTMQRTMGALGYRKCLSCGKTWMNRRIRDKRTDWAKKMLEGLPGDEWKKVRFSCELHFGFGLDGAMRLLPRSGEKYCPQCDGDGDGDGNGDGEEGGGKFEKWSRDVKRLHAWAAVGHNFKSELVFYDDSTNPHASGTITMADCEKKVLAKVVKDWLHPLNGGPESFILEEDVDAYGHGGLSKVNPVQEWKRAAGLRNHFSCGDSPDLSPLDSLWPPGKMWKMPKPLEGWEDEALREAAREAWREVMPQEKVNMWVEFMPARLREVIATDGRLVSW